MHQESTPHERNTDIGHILSKLEKVQKTHGGFKARCPAHEDKEPSLSISQGKDGRVLLKCFAGCNTQAVCSALGLTLKDLFPKTGEASSDKREIEAIYPYADESGAVIYEVVRFKPKDFRQRHQGVDGKWIWSMQDVRRVLYRLPEVLESIRDSPNKPILIVEGEKDVNTLFRLNYTATCNVGGAGKWLAEYSACLAGATVVLIPDKDEPGRKHAQLVGDSLKGIAKDIRYLDLPNMEGRAAIKDVSDYLERGGSAELLDRLIAKAPPFGVATDSWIQITEDAADIMPKQFPPVVEVVQGLITERSKAVIGSGSKSFKTWFTIDAAISISHGIPFLERETKRQRVLYCNLELKADTFGRRLQWVAKARGVNVEKEWLLHLPLRGQMAGQIVFETISRIIKVAHHFKAETIVLDPIYKLNVEGEENNSKDQTLFFNQLDRITTEAGCTVILNDHFGKGNQSEKDPLDAIRGSSAKGGDVDAALILRRHEEPECFRVDVVHRELPPVDPFVIGWEAPLMRLKADLDPDAMKKAAGGRTAKHDPLKLLKAIEHTTSSEPISVSDWASKARIQRQTLYGYLTEMREKGWTGSIGDGPKARKYITPKGKAALEHG